MIYLSIAMVIIAGMAFYLVNKYLDQKMLLNTASSKDELSAAVSEMHKQFDTRINNAYGNIGSIKEELNALRMQIGLKGNK